MEANGLGVTRALAMHQIPCIGLAGPRSAPPTKTNTCHVIHTRSWNESEVISELKAIAQRLDRKAPLLITKDEPVLWISQFRNELSDAYEIYLPHKDVVNLLMSKTNFLELAAREGWPIPTSWKIDNKDDLMSGLPDVTFPCILKPRVKNTEFRKYSPRKAFKLATAHQLVEVYNMVAQWEKEVIIQEWIEGGDDRIAFCLSYYDRNGKPIVLFPGRKLLQWPIECGNTAISEPAPKEWEELIIVLTERIWEKVGFKGIGSIEFKLRKDSDQLVIMEPTVGRTNYQNELAVINGQNIPAIAYFDLAGMGCVPLARTSIPVKLINGGAEIRACLEYYRCGSFTLLQWVRNRKGKKKYMMWRMNDIGPFMACAYVAAKGVLSRCIESFLGQEGKKKIVKATRLIRLIAGGS